VRIGLHLSEAEERAGNYFGSVVNQAARVMAVAHGGQIVITDAVRDAVAATRSLATTINEDVARRPSIGSDVLVTFAYLAHLGGDVDHAQAIIRRVSPVLSYATWCWLILAPQGGTVDDTVERLDRFVEAHPVLERVRYTAEHGASMLDDECSRWV
jgi:hypothetical protein